MFTRVHTAVLVGIEAHPVLVEAHRLPGLPQVELVGLARGAAREALPRVRSAISATGLALPSQRVIVSLMPAELPKDASALDLAVAVALLVAGGLLPAQAPQGRRFFGELSLGGGVEAVRGATSVAALCRRQSEHELLVPAAVADEAAVIPGLRVLGARSLAEVVLHLRGEQALPTATGLGPAAEPRGEGCFSEVRGQARAKRALELAAAGGHNVLLLGPPGSGKTMLARRLPGILPPLDLDERIEVTSIHSAAGLDHAAGLVSHRPFRAPHHSASDAALCGGGSLPRPGEVTLAHRGVLFLDELPEFSRRALEGLREPLEDGVVHVSRAASSLCFPARALLVAAMNPCPCGYFQGDLGAAPPLGGRLCLCAFDQIQRYRARLSGPLLDRIDLHVIVDSPRLLGEGSGAAAEPSSEVRPRVERARGVQKTRLGPARTNASLTPKELDVHVPLVAPIVGVLADGMATRGLSPRGVDRVRKLARTIADLAGEAVVLVEHVREALDFRVLDAGGSVLGGCGPESQALSANAGLVSEPRRLRSTR